MLILISCLLLFATSLALIILRVTQPDATYAWLAATGGALLSLTSVFLWLIQMPFNLVLPSWKPSTIFTSSILFRADSTSWPLALGIVALTLSIFLTAANRPVYQNSFSWAGTLALGGLGLLAVTADSPLTLLLAWAALDLTELLTQLGSVNGPKQNESVVISFSTRALGIGLLLWASIVSLASGNPFDFQSMSPRSGIFLIAASGLRLGVLPLHLPYSPNSRLRRGFGTSLRLVSAVSSLVLLGRVPTSGMNPLAINVLMVFAIVAAIYSGWMWLRAPDTLNSRPFWIISIASLSVIAALSGNPNGAVAWGSALILIGGALFISSIQKVWLNRILLLGAFGLSSLPFSLTAGAWTGNIGLFIPFIIIAQTLLIAGFVRHSMRSTDREELNIEQRWVGFVFPSGIILLLALQLFLGLAGWDGARQIGAWLQAIIGSILTLGLVWAIPRLRIFSPLRAHWVTSPSSRMNNLYQGFWSVYRTLARISQSINQALEGEGGVMWALLFIVLFVSILTQGAP